MVPASLTPITPDPIGMLRAAGPWRGAAIGTCSRRARALVPPRDTRRADETELLRIPCCAPIAYAPACLNVLLILERALIRHDRSRPRRRDTLKTSRAYFVDLQPEVGRGVKASSAALKPQESQLERAVVTSGARRLAGRMSDPRRHRKITECTNPPRDRYRAWPAKTD